MKMPGIGPAEPVGIGQPVRRAAEPGRRAGATPAGDKVEFSRAAVQAGDLRDELAAVDAVRRDRVDALRQAVAEGSYRPPAADVAAAMLRRGVFRQ